METSGRRASEHRLIDGLALQVPTHLDATEPRRSDGLRNQERRQASRPIQSVHLGGRAPEQDPHLFNRERGTGLREREHVRVLLDGDHADTAA